MQSDKTAPYVTKNEERGFFGHGISTTLKIIVEEDRNYTLGFWKRKSEEKLLTTF